MAVPEPNPFTGCLHSVESIRSDDHGKTYCLECRAARSRRFLERIPIKANFGVARLGLPLFEIVPKEKDET